MEANNKTRRLLRLQGAAFAALFLASIGLLAWLSTRYHYSADWTANGRHTLSAASIGLLQQLDAPVEITAFARDSELAATRKHIADLIGRYQRHKPDINLRFIDPDMEPDQVRAAGISLDGELVVEYQGRSQHVQALNEQEISNTLQRLARSGERRVLFLEGHGERNPLGSANHDLGAFGEQLRNKGFNLASHNLSANPELSQDISALVIASPQVDLFPGEVKLIQQYVEQGGNLLWLAEPGGLHQLDPLAAQLGLKFHPGTIVDPTTQLLGIDNAAFAVVVEYPPHVLTQDLASVTLFPFAAALDPGAVSAPWQATPLLTTVPRSWAETGDLRGSIRFEATDIAGPLTLGIVLERSLVLEQHPTEGASAPSRQQRVAVIGDGDFLSNTYLGNGANLELGLRLANWLSQDDSLLHIPPRTSHDRTLDLTPALSTLLGLGFLFVIPAALLSAGIVIWLKRRKR